MRISKISLYNFRIYKGLNSIEFKSTANGKNITILAGQNGFGKTTFLTALVWGFYGRLITEVDEKYKKEIFDIGGYKNYANSILNRKVKSSLDLEKLFSVEIELKDVSIPSVPCKTVKIIRTYNAESDDENTRVLIDGYENELTKEVGSDIFINDFILPREIAKFFLFDAEKIVSLAEIRNKSEKRNLNKAYSEVLGISKYENLKKHLETLRVKLRKKSASISDQKKLDNLINDANQLRELISLNESQINDAKIDIEKNRTLSEQYQEKLIREGNTMSVEDIIKAKKLRDSLKLKNAETKAQLKDLVDLAPFAIASKKLLELNDQVHAELEQKQDRVDREYFENNLTAIKNQIKFQVKQRKFSDSIGKEINDILDSVFEPNPEYKKSKSVKTLLDLTEQQRNELLSIIENLTKSYKEQFKALVKEEKDSRFLLNQTLRKISNAESKENDLLVKRYKSEKLKVDKLIKELSETQIKLMIDNGILQQDLATKTKLISELTKTVQLDEINEQKDKVTSRLIDELNLFIVKFKSEKKHALQDRLKQELQKLMHKADFIDNVLIDLNEDLLEISLFDKAGNEVEKESLSKGEQQLYATALLKSLVDESGIQFPIFIDSPLQKFDKTHSKNIIKEFYPSISRQVILFPLLEKELTENEYTLLAPNIAQAFVIKSKNAESSIVEVELTDLFNELNPNYNVYSYKNVKSE